MDAIPVRLLLYGFPECALLIGAALSLMGVKIGPVRTLTSALALALGVQVGRLVWPGTGYHSLVAILGLAGILVLVFRLSVAVAALGASVSFLLLLLGESLLLAPVMKLAAIRLEEVWQHDWLGIGLGWLSDGFLILTVVLCRLTGFVLVRPARNRPS